MLETTLVEINTRLSNIATIAIIILFAFFIFPHIAPGACDRVRYFPTFTTRTAYFGDLILAFKGFLTRVNSDNSAKVEIAEHVAAELTALGVSVTLNKLSWHDYTAALAAGTYDLYIGEVRMTANFDVTELFFGTLNYGGYQSEAVQAAAGAWKASGETADAWMLWKGLVQEVPIAPLCFKKETLLITWGMGIRPTPLREDLFFGLETWPVRPVGEEKRVLLSQHPFDILWDYLLASASFLRSIMRGKPPEPKEKMRLTRLMVAELAPVFSRISV